MELLSLPSAPWSAPVVVHEFTPPGSTPRELTLTANRAAYVHAVATSTTLSQTAATIRLQAAQRKHLSWYRAYGIVIRERKSRRRSHAQAALSHAVAAARLQLAARRLLRRIRTQKAARILASTFRLLILDPALARWRRAAASLRQAEAQRRMQLHSMRYALVCWRRAARLARQVSLIESPSMESYRALWADDVAKEEQLARGEDEALAQRALQSVSAPVPSKKKPMHKEAKRFRPRISLMVA